eukprot:12298224-Alexandrium_andersonii.AAC.1
MNVHDLGDPRVRVRVAACMRASACSASWRLQAKAVKARTNDRNTDCQATAAALQLATIQTEGMQHASSLRAVSEKNAHADRRSVRTQTHTHTLPQPQ